MTFSKWIFAGFVLVVLPFGCSREVKYPHISVRLLTNDYHYEAILMVFDELASEYDLPKADRSDRMSRMLERSVISIGYDDSNRSGVLVVVDDYLAKGTISIHIYDPIEGHPVCKRFVESSSKKLREFGRFIDELKCSEQN